MNVNFTKIRYRNFLSSGDQFTEIPLDQAPLTLIVGKNGAGKSTVLDALCFCLFKKPFRKINLGLLVNSVTKKNCVVEIEFSIGEDQYLITRAIKPNKFEIYKNGTLVNHTNSDDYQIFLEQNILHINHKAFCQVVVLGSASYIPFLELSTPDRRKIIENLLDLEIFSVMNVILKKRVQDNDKLLRDITSQQVLLNDRIKQMQDYQNKREAENAEKIVGFEAMLNGYRELIKEKRQFIKDKISQSVLDELKEKQTALEKEMQEARTQQALLRSEIGKLEKEINFYLNSCKCDVCKQDIDEAFKKEIISDKSKILEKNKCVLLNSDSKIDLGKDSLSRIIQKVNEINNHNQGQERIEFEVNSILKQGMDTKTLVEKIKSEVVADQSNDLKILNEQLDVVNKNFDELTKKAETMGVALKLLKDDGIKASVVLQYIDIINGLINQFLLEMDFVCQFNLDENFNEVIKSRYKDEFVYSSFSEGEKLRIDLSLLLTWREVAARRNSINTNILFFDEVLDSSLDSEGIEGYLNILKRITANQNVFIISHNEKNIDRIENVIKFDKSKGFSRIIL